MQSLSRTGSPFGEHRLGSVERMVIGALVVALLGALAYQVMTDVEYPAAWFALFCIGTLTVVPFLVAVYRPQVDVFEPIYLVMLAYLLYFVYAPAADLLEGREYFFGFHVIPGLPRALLVAGIGLVSLMVGYYARPGRTIAARLPALTTERQGAVGYGIALAILATIFFGAYIRASGLSWTRFLTLGQLGANPADVLAGETADSPLLNYLAATVDWYVAAFMAFFAFATRRRRLLWVMFLAVLAIYTTMGFRYRLVVLILAPLIYHFLRSGRRPGSVKIALAGLTCWAVIGVVGELRTNFRSGLPVDPETLTLEDTHGSFVGSLSIYQPYVAVVDAYPERHPFLLGRSYIYLLAHPIPRSLWPGKPEPPVYRIIRDAFEDDLPQRAGVAYPNLGEYYADFGLIGIVIGMLLFGVAMRTLYEYIRLHAASEWARIFYAIAVPFLVQVVSRGYFVSVVQEAVFFLGPVIAAGWIQRVFWPARGAAPAMLPVHSRATPPIIR